MWLQQLNPFESTKFTFEQKITSFTKILQSLYIFYCILTGYLQCLVIVD